MIIKYVRLIELNISFPEYTNFKDDLKENKYLCCNKNWQQQFDEN